MSDLLGHVIVDFDFPYTASRFQGEAELALIEGIHLIQQRGFSEGVKKMVEAMRVIQALPRIVRNELAMLAYEASLEAQIPNVTFKDFVDPRYLSLYQKEYFKLLGGLRHQFNKDIKLAQKTYRELSHSHYPKIELIARMHLLNLNNFHSHKDIEKYDALRFLWRGDLHEFRSASNPFRPL